MMALRAVVSTRLVMGVVDVYNGIPELLVQAGCCCTGVLLWGWDAAFHMQSGLTATSHAATVSLLILVAFRAVAALN
jgi:hypothetical protein